MKLIKFEKIDFNETMDQNHHFVFSIRTLDKKMVEFHFVFTSFIKRTKKYIDTNDFSEKFGAGRYRYGFLLLGRKWMIFNKVFQPENSILKRVIKKPDPKCEKCKGSGGKEVEINNEKIFRFCECVNKYVFVTNNGEEFLLNGEEK